MMTAEMASQVDPVMCFQLGTGKGRGMWKAENPLVESLPTFVLQLALTLLTVRLLLLVLKPFRQPRFMAEILVGIIVYPTLMCFGNDVVTKIFPYDSLDMVEIAASLGLVFHVFLIGLEMDLSSITMAGERAFSIAIAGIVLPLGLGTFSFFWLMGYQNTELNPGGAVLWGLVVTVTGVQTVTRVLASLKLLHTDLGKLAMSSAVINEIFVWVILAVTVPVANQVGTSGWAVLATAVFILFSIFAVRPAIKWMLKKCPEGDRLTEFQFFLILAGVMISAVMTDACGSYSIIGGFVFGLVFPTGDRATEIMEKLEDTVSGILVPLYFVTCGIRINLESLLDGETLVKVAMVVALLCLAKIVSSLMVYVLYGMPIQEGLGLGLVLNVKDIMALVILNIGRDTRNFNNLMYTVMVAAMVVMTGMVVPLMNMTYPSRARFLRYRNRSIEKSQTDGELRILTCLHQTRNVPGIISLLEASNPISRSPISVCALHLVELTARSSAMLIIHNTQNSAASIGPANPKSTHAQSEQIVTAFQDLELRHHDAVSVQSLTVMSPYTTMDEDICNIAEDKRVALTVLPFHKQQNADGQMEEEGDTAVRRVNQNVLANASSSVAIFVDRGFGALSYPHRRICVLFFCGPDDREALSYSWRMAGHPTAMLSVIRFIPSKKATDLHSFEDVNDNFDGILTAITEYETQKSMDDEFLENFRIKTSGDENMAYTEIVLNNGEETVTTIRGIDSHYDLFVVGRGQKVLSPLAAGLNEWSECPELGAIGDILVTSDFASTASVLVIQQSGEITMAEPESPAESINDGETKGFEHSDWREVGENYGFDPYVRNTGRETGWNA